jgi:hypothetical protein
MTQPVENYEARAGMYRLLVGYGAMTLTNDATGPAVYRTTLDSMLADANVRDIVTYLAGTAFGGYIQKCGGDVKAATALIVQELRVAEDLASLDGGGGL